jgi:hypothetical protein
MPRCVKKCVKSCVTPLCTSVPVRPRQHWVFGGSPSPTTRPPRLRSSCGVRVVGLGAEWFGWLAGMGLFDQVSELQLVAAEKEVWKGDLGWLG